MKNADAIRREIASRAKKAKEASEKPVFSIEKFCFPEQIKFIRDLSRFKTGVCGRRGGKTISCAADLHDTTETQVGDVAYITLSRTSAKKIIWRDLTAINKDFQLGGKLDNTELTITKPNGNIIHVTGAKDASEIEKLRGMKFRKVYIDECQSFRAYLKDMIEDVIEPALTDFYGSLILIGTPGPIPAGYFYDVTHAQQGWSHHHWTMVQNPHIERQSGRKPIDIINEMALRRGLTLDSASIQREYFGQWIKDIDSLVLHFTPGLNHATELPTDMVYIFGMDIGFKDADAIAVLGYSSTNNKVYLVEEHVQRKQDITSFVKAVERLQAKYKPVRMVMDAGGLGKKIQEEIRMRHGIPIEAAEKHRKFEFITLLNDDLRTGKFQAIHGTQFEEDCSLVQWNYDNPEKPKISDIYHTDIGDAVLYGWRECRHYLFRPEPAKPDKNSDAYMKELEDREAEAMEAKLNGGEDFTDVNSWEDIGVSDSFDDL